MVQSNTNEMVGVHATLCSGEEEDRVILIQEADKLNAHSPLENFWPLNDT